MHELAEKLDQAYNSLDRHNLEPYQAGIRVGYMEAVEDVIAYLDQEGWTDAQAAIERERDRARNVGQPTECACGRKALVSDKEPGGRGIIHGYKACVYVKGE